jgi:RNA polymerase sigma-70 factor (ECF subfamily)
MTDEELLNHAGRGDEAAFLELYQRHREPVFRFAYRMFGSIELGEDTTHDCFLNLVRSPEKFDAQRGSLRSYLFGVVRNMAMARFRREGLDVSLDEVVEELPVIDSHPLDKMLNEEMGLIVREAVSRLPPVQREALVLFEYEEMSLAEIAGITNADVGTIKGRLFRARQSMKRLLAPYFGNDAERHAYEEVCK